MTSVYATGGKGGAGFVKQNRGKLGEEQRVAKTAGELRTAFIVKRTAFFYEMNKAYLDPIGSLNTLRVVEGKDAPPPRLWLVGAPVTFGSPYLDESKFGVRALGLPEDFALTVGVVHTLTKSGGTEVTPHFTAVYAAVKAALSQVPKKTYSPENYLYAMLCVKAFDGDFDESQKGVIQIFVPKKKRNILHILNEHAIAMGVMRDIMMSSRMDLAWMISQLKIKAKMYEKTGGIGFDPDLYKIELLELLISGRKRLDPLIEIFEWGHLGIRNADSIVKAMRKAKKILGYEPSYYGGSSAEINAAIQKAAQNKLLRSTTGGAPRKGNGGGQGAPGAQRQGGGLPNADAGASAPGNGSSSSSSSSSGGAGSSSKSSSVPRVVKVSAGFIAMSAQEKYEELLNGLNMAGLQIDPESDPDEEEEDGAPDAPEAKEEERKDWSVYTLSMKMVADGKATQGEADSFLKATTEKLDPGVAATFGNESTRKIGFNSKGEYIPFKMTADEYVARYGGKKSAAKDLLVIKKGLVWEPKGGGGLGAFT